MSLVLSKDEKMSTRRDRDFPSHEVLYGDLDWSGGEFPNHYSNHFLNEIFHNF